MSKVRDAGPAACSFLRAQATGSAVPRLISPRRCGPDDRWCTRVIPPWRCRVSRSEREIGRGFSSPQSHAAQAVLELQAADQPASVCAAWTGARSSRSAAAGGTMAARHRLGGGRLRRLPADSSALGSGGLGARDVPGCHRRAAGRQQPSMAGAGPPQSDEPAAAAAATARTRCFGSTGEPRPKTRSRACSASSRRCRRATTEGSRGQASNSRGAISPSRSSGVTSSHCGLAAETVAALWDSLTEQVDAAGLVLGAHAALPERRRP